MAEAKKKTPNLNRIAGRGTEQMYADDTLIAVESMEELKEILLELEQLNFYGDLE